MEWQYILLLVIGGIVALMFTGLPVAFCFMAVNLVDIYIMWGWLVGWEQLSRSIC